MQTEYDFQSYLYPAGSTASGGGAGSGSSTGTTAPAKPLQIGRVQTLDGYSSATATLEETPTASVLNLGIPKGLSAFDLAGGNLLYSDTADWLATLKGAKGDKGDTGDAGTADLSAGAIKGALGADSLARMQQLMSDFEAAFVPKPADMKNNEWYTINFGQRFDDISLAGGIVLVFPLLSDYRNFLVNAITSTGFSIRCNYVPDFQGLYYLKFSTKY